jgi:hypothetical protein
VTSMVIRQRLQCPVLNLAETMFTMVSKALQQRTCSMKVHASLNVSAIFNRTMTTDTRRLQKAAVASWSHCTKLFFVGITPMLCSLQQVAWVQHTMVGAESVQVHQSGAPDIASAITGMIASN